MIIKLKGADFSANNVGKIDLPGGNINTGEGTNTPLLFKYSTSTGSGEFLGVDFITKENPSPFPIIRKLHMGGTGKYLYEFQTAERNTIGINPSPTNLSMALWVNKTMWEALGTSRLALTLQGYDSGWKASSEMFISFSDLSSESEITGDYTNTNFSVTFKKKVLATQTINNEVWVCVGIVLTDIDVLSTFDGAIRMAFLFTMMTSGANMEVANMQLVETSDYLNPTEEY